MNECICIYILDSDGEGYGEFEDLQTGEVFGGPGAATSDSDDDSDSGSEALSDDNNNIDEQLRALNDIYVT